MNRTTQAAFHEHHAEWKQPNLNTKAFGTLLASMFALTVGTAALGVSEAHAAARSEILLTEPSRLPSPPLTHGLDVQPGGTVANGRYGNGLSVNGLRANGVMTNGIGTKASQSDALHETPVFNVKRVQLRDGRTMTVR